MPSIRVLLADDQALFREGLHTLLSVQPDLEVVGEAANGEEAVRLATTLRPDVVLMDLQMPQMDGFAAARAIRAMSTPLGQVPIFALTASVMPEQIAAAQEAGMNGHIGKPLSREALATALGGLRNLKVNRAKSPEANSETASLTDTATLDPRVLELLKSELKGAAAGVVREFMVEIQTIRDQFVAELGQAVPRADIITQNLHRLLGAARTLGAMQLAQYVTELQKLQPSDSAIFHARNTQALQHLIGAIDIALEHLEAFFQARLVGVEVNA